MSTGETPTFTDEQLFWGAYQAMGRDVASRLPDLKIPLASIPGMGMLLDLRLEEIRQTRFPLYEDKTEGWQPLSIEERLVYCALTIAVHDLDNTFGERTGYHRTGCSMGGPRRFARQQG